MRIPIEEPTAFSFTFHTALENYLPIDSSRPESEQAEKHENNDRFVFNSIFHYHECINVEFLNFCSFECFKLCFSKI